MLWRSWQHKCLEVLKLRRVRCILLRTLAGMLPVFSAEPILMPPPCRLRALSLRRRLLLSRCSLCLFCTSIRAVMNVFFTSFSNSSSSRRANWLISSSEYSRMAVSTRCSSSTRAELGIRLRPTEWRGWRDGPMNLFCGELWFQNTYACAMIGKISISQQQVVWKKHTKNCFQ